MTLRSLGLFVKKLQPKVGLGGYDILFAYFVVEAKSKNKIQIPRILYFFLKSNFKFFLKMD